MDQPNHYQVIVLGAGPAGATAGIYLAEFKLKTLLLNAQSPHYSAAMDSHRPEHTPMGMYFNVPGFPQGIHRQELKWLCIEQAQRAGCDAREDTIESVSRSPQYFTVTCRAGTFTADTLIFALGVENALPDIPGINHLIDRSLFWWVEFNGAAATNKPSAVVGVTDRAALSALRLKNYTDSVVLLTHGQPLSCTPAVRHLLEKERIPVIETRIKTLSSEHDYLSRLTFSNNEELPVEVLFSPEHEHRPRSEMARALGVHVDAAGFIQVNEWFETNVPHIYAVGDITSRGPEQVITACYHGMQAAIHLSDTMFQRRLQHQLAQVAIPA